MLERQHITDSIGRVTVLVHLGSFSIPYFRVLTFSTNCNLTLTALFVVIQLNRDNSINKVCFPLFLIFNSVFLVL